MKFLLLRHGESEGNVAGIINDDPSRRVDLTTRGRAQAAAVAERLRGLPFTRACASEFARAQQTAQIVLQYHQIELNIDARLNERKSGMDGLPVEAFNGMVSSDPLHCKPVGGESFVEQMHRMRSFLDAAATGAGLVLAVTHGNPIAAAQALLSTHPERLSTTCVDNCVLVELEWPGAGFSERAMPARADS